VGASFEAITVNECCGGGTVIPPDPEMAAGPNHVIAIVNLALEIYDKSGSSVSGPTTLSSFYSALGGTNCTAGGPFDPNVVYDEKEGRWLVGADGNGNVYCAGVSLTNDPTGSWYLYEFPTNVLNRFFDYPPSRRGRRRLLYGRQHVRRPIFGGARVGL